MKKQRVYAIIYSRIVFVKTDNLEQAEQRAREMKNGTEWIDNVYLAPKYVQENWGKKCK